jgi:hypothetical protein
MRAAAVAMLLVGCREVTATQLVVTFDAESQSRERAGCFCARVRDEASVERRSKCSALGERLTFPLRSSYVPRDGNEDTVFRVEGFLFDRGMSCNDLECLDDTCTPFNERLERYSFIEGEYREADFTFEDACAAVRCPESATCVNCTCIGGTCQSAPVENGSTALAGRTEDLQDGQCGATWCFEHPRPGRGRAMDGCLDSETTGYIAQQDELLRYEAGFWTMVRPLASRPWRMACFPGGHVILAGGDLLLESSGGDWREIALPTGASANAVWGASADDVWVVGDGGSVMRRRGGVWANPIPPGTAPALGSVWGRSASEVYAAGDSAFGRIDSGAFAVLPVPAPPDGASIRELSGDPTSVYGLSGDFDYGVNNAPVMRFDGAAWIATTHSGYTIGHAAGSMYVGGARGTLISVDGAGVATRIDPVPWGGNVLSSISSFGGSLLVVGRNGVHGILRIGSSPPVWTATPVRFSQQTFNDVARRAGDPIAALVVGQGGAIGRRIAPSVWREVALHAPGALERSTAVLHAVAYAGERGIAVGELDGAGVIAEDDGRDFLIVEGLSLPPLRAIDATSVPVAAGGGAIVEKLDGAWTVIAVHPTATFTAVTRSSAGEIFAGTSAGAVYRVNGAAFVELAPEGAACGEEVPLCAIRRIHATGDSLFALGNRVVELAGDRRAGVPLTVEPMTFPWGPRIDEVVFDGETPIMIGLNETAHALLVHEPSYAGPLARRAALGSDGTVLFIDGSNGIVQTVPLRE